MTVVRRVLMVVTAPQRRGAEVFAADLARSLETRSVEVRTVYLRSHTDSPLPTEPDDVVLTTSGQDEVAPWSPRLLRDLMAVINDFDPDVVQVNGGSTVKYGAIARRLSKGRWRLVYRNIGDPRVWMRGQLRPLLYKHLVFSQVDGLVGVSNETLRGHREIFGDRIPAIHVPRSIDAAMYTPSRSRDDVRRQIGTEIDAPVLLFIGALAPEKRLDRLIRVFQQVRRDHQNAVLWIAGSGAESEALRDLVSEAGLETSIQVLGVRDDIPDLLHGADVVVLTSDTEGLPGVLLEAGAAGRPCVATGVGGVASCVDDGVTGRVIDRDDEAAFANAVGLLIDDPEVRSKMGSAARAKVEEDYALDGAAERYVEFYTHLIGAST